MGSQIVHLINKFSLEHWLQTFCFRGKSNLLSASICTHNFCEDDINVMNQHMFYDFLSNMVKKSRVRNNEISYALAASKLKDDYLQILKSVKKLVFQIQCRQALLVIVSRYCS